MNIHADKKQENKSRSITNEIDQKRNGNGLTSQFLDNRHEAITQKKNQVIVNNSPQAKQTAQFQAIGNNNPQGMMAKTHKKITHENDQLHASNSAHSLIYKTEIQLMKRAGGDEDDPPAKRARRASTIAAGLPPSDAHGRTRGASFAAEVHEGAALAPARRNLSTTPFQLSADGTRLWDGTSRLGWGDLEETFYGNQLSQGGTRADGSARIEYSCVIDDSASTVFLPRRADADAGEDTASIGHIIQWRDYIADNAVTERWDVEGGEILAISMEEAERCYRDIGNLQLQGQAYNSSVATTYASDAPGQDWVNI